MRIDTPTMKDIPQLRLLWKEAFGDSDEFLDVFFGTAFSCGRCRCAFDEGNLPVSALYWFDCSYNEAKTAYLYAIATDKKMRGRGLCSALMRDTESFLKHLGYDAAMLLPADHGLRRYYERFGYRTATYLATVEVSASRCVTNIRALSPDEYTAKRREYLPKNAVLQENENVAFLSGIATLSAGDDFLLAYRKSGTSLLGIELLGNTDRAPDILCTLGADRGLFKTVGDTVPFAMHLPLTERGKTVPSYFGLAFD